MIPGLERAEFLRYGQIHRNTYINAPALLTPTLQLRTHPQVFFAGQISGVEGYVESIATGLVAGRHAVELAAGADIRAFPARDGARIAVRVCFRRRRAQLPAGQHHVRFAAHAGRSDAAAVPARQKGAPRRSLPAGAREAGRIQFRLCLTCPGKSGYFWTNCAVRTLPQHTVRNYASDLDQFLAYFTLPGETKPTVEGIDALAIREWLGHLYEQRLTAVSMRRKLAAVRSFFKFLLREGLVEKNVARMVRTPKMPKTLPEVMTAEQTNALVDGVTGAADKFERPYPARDLAIFELLYGCGLRISELVGLNLDDFDFSERWIRVRGKGKKERQVPYAGKATAALDRYLALRKPAGGHAQALFLNHRGGRLTDRGARGIVKFYARDDHRRFVHPSAQPAACLRHASAERWRRSASHPGAAGACQAIHDTEIHASVAGRSDGRV